MPFRTGKSKVYQYDIQVAGRRFRGSCKTKSFEDAKKVESDVRSNAEKQAATSVAFTLSEALGTYHQDVMVGKASENTSASQSRAILSIMDGNMPLSNLTQANLYGYAAKDRKKCSNGTVNRRLQLLGRAVRHMLDYGATLPKLDFKKAEAKEPKERIRELSLEEQARLFQHLPEEYRPFVTFALMTGARIATISNLKWTDVQLDKSEMVFRLKDDETMTFPMNAEVRALLSSLTRSNALEHRNIVFTRVDQQTLKRVPIVPNGGVFNDTWRETLAKAQIYDFRFHDLRHTFATRILRQTQNLKLTGRLLGHKTLDATMRYAHIMIDDMRNALDGFSAYSGDETGINPQKKPHVKSVN